MAPACRFQLAKLFLPRALSRAPFAVSGCFPFLSRLISLPARFIPLCPLLPDSLHRFLCSGKQRSGAAGANHAGYRDRPLRSHTRNDARLHQRLPGQACRQRHQDPTRPWPKRRNPSLPSSATQSPGTGNLQDLRSYAAGCPSSRFCTHGQTLNRFSAQIDLSGPIKACRPTWRPRAAATLTYVL